MRPSFWNGEGQQQPPTQSQQQHHRQVCDQSQPSPPPHFGGVRQPFLRQRHESGQQQGNASGGPPAVVLLSDSAGGGGTNGGIPGRMASSKSGGGHGQPATFLVRNPSMDIQSPADSSGEQPMLLLGGGHRNAAANFSSRSPSATSLTSNGGGVGALTLGPGGGSSSHHCSPNPSPPPGQQQQQPAAPKYGAPIRVQTAGSASVARMMSALLKQQNSIAEEDTDGSSLDEPSLPQSLRAPLANGTPPAVLQHEMEQQQQQKCWLAPPDHTLLGGNISPPPTRIHPLQDPELRRELAPASQQHHQQRGQSAAASAGGQQQGQLGQTLANTELGRHLVSMTTPFAAGPASPSSAATSAQQQQQRHQYKREREESGGRCGGGTGWSRQQSQPWGATTGRGATSKHRKGSLSPNNSLRYSTLMAAATRRNHFQQQRTTSEATPAQRDQLMADVLGHGIREQCICASVSAPSPRLMASSVGMDPSQQHCSSHHSSGGVPSPHHSCSLRFELGGGDSSASSLCNQPAGHSCSQCSSANSLHRADSIRHGGHRLAHGHRGRLHTADGCSSSGGDQQSNGGAGSGSLPRLVSLVPPSFPPASTMLSSSSSDQQQRETRPESRAAEHHKESIKEERKHRHQREAAAEKSGDKQREGGKPSSGHHETGCQQSQGSSLCPPSLATIAILRRDPARWNLAATKQRSSSESAFSAIQPKASGGGGGQCPGCACTCPSCQPIGDDQLRSSLCEAQHHEQQQKCICCPLQHHRSSRTAGNGPTAMRRPDSMSALGGQGRCSIALARDERQQAILQRILGPAGLGWLKQRDPLLKKSLSLVLTEGDVEAQRLLGTVSAISGTGLAQNAGGGGGGGSEKGGGGSMMDESNCSVKQPLVKEKERGGRFIKRQQLFNRRRVTSDYALFFALFGIVLMIVENEFAYTGHFGICAAIKTVIMMSTIVLVGLVVKFHVHEIQIFMNANSAEDWQIALTCRKTMQICVEIVACAICPLPVQLDVYVTTVNADGQAVPMRMPLDVLFSILMFFRLYWLCRVMLLHSRLFTDAASRSIAGLNRVKTDAKFILKTLMTICPGTVLMLFTATLWMIGGYILRLCERHHDLGDDDDPILSVQAEKHQSYLNSLWLIAVTFLSIGYGDIVPNTQCGRIMAVVTGILGTCTSSMVVAVIARKLELSRAEKHVHNFMIETQHTKEMKHIAANVLRETWLIYKNRRLVEKIDPGRIRYHQRKFLVAICALRKLKTSQRKLDENRISLGDVAKTTSHSHELMRDVHTTQEGMALRITAVEHQLSDIQRELSGISEMLKYAIRPPMDYGCVPQLQLQQHQQIPTMVSGPHSPVEMRQRRKPSTISEPPF